METPINAAFQNEISDYLADEIIGLIDAIPREETTEDMAGAIDDIVKLLLAMKKRFNLLPATKPLPADKNAENQAVETGRHAPESSAQNIPARPLPKGLKRYSGEYPTGGDGYFSMSVSKTNKEAAIKYFLKQYPWMDRDVIRHCLMRSK